MTRVTKAQLQTELTKASEMWRFWEQEAEKLDRKSDHLEAKLSQLEDLYTRVRIAVGGGTGQEPWDIFTKIKYLHEWKAETERAWKKQDELYRRIDALTYPPSWWSRTKPRLAAWWGANSTLVFHLVAFAWVATIWFFIGRANAQ